jgi:hypothetical protein
MYGNGKSNFALHLLENGHDIGLMEDIMNTIHITGNGRLMDTLEKFYIFLETKLNNQINDKLAVKPNIIFDTIVQKIPIEGYTMSTTRHELPPNSVRPELCLRMHKQPPPQLRQVSITSNLYTRPTATTPAFRIIDSNPETKYLVYLSNRM